MPLTIQPSPTRNLVPLFSSAAWSKHTNATVSADGKTLTLNATGTSQLSTLDIPATKGSTYVLEIEATGGGTIDFGSVGFNPGGFWVEKTHDISPANGKYVLSVVAKSNVLRINLFNRTSSGTFIFSNLSLTKAQPPSPTRNLVPLFTDPAWTKHANATVSPDGKTLTLNATAGNQNSWWDFIVTPSTTYELTVDTTASSSSPYFEGQEYVGATYVRRAFSTTAVGRQKLVFTTLPGSSRIRVFCNNNGAGTFTFSNLTLTKALPTFAPAKAREFFKELVVNGGFDGAAGWTPANFSRSYEGGKLTITANGNYQGATNVTPIDVLPNTTYVLKGVATGYVDADHTPYVQAGESDANGTFIRFPFTRFGTQEPFRFEIEFITSSRARKLNVTVSNFGVGTYTFDNISLKRKAP